MTEPNQTKTAETQVNDWLYHQGECPDDMCITIHFKYLIDGWKLARGDGMDVLASSHLNQLKALVNVLDGI